MIIGVIIFQKLHNVLTFMRSFTSEAFIIWTLHFFAQNPSEMRWGQKNELRSKFESVHNNKIHSLKLEMNRKERKKKRNKIL